MTEDEIKKMLTHDFKKLYMLMAEIINSPACMDALTKVIHGHHKALHDAPKEPMPAPLFDQATEANV